MFNNDNIIDSESFEFKAEITGRMPDNGMSCAIEILE